jgi:hypothetical protein
MIATNNPAEGPFAMVRAFLHMFPTMKLRTVTSLAVTVVNGTHRSEQVAGGKVRSAGLALTADPYLNECVFTLSGVRR